MFHNLIESNAHTAEIKRRGSFLFATMAAYALLLLLAGVGSIYAYEAHVDNQSLELTALVTMIPATAAPTKSSPPPLLILKRAPSPWPTYTQVSTRTIRQSSVIYDEDSRRSPVTGTTRRPHCLICYRHGNLCQAAAQFGGSPLQRERDRRHSSAHPAKGNYQRHAPD